MKDLSKYRQNKPKFFTAPEYWFKKNKNLSVMNFKLEDQMGLSQDHFWSNLKKHLWKIISDKLIDIHFLFSHFSIP